MKESIKEWLSTNPETLETAPTSGGGSYIPITIAEDLLDKYFSWSTRNFSFYMYKGEGYGSLGVAASLELVVEYKDASHQVRTFVGACNFSTKEIFPNTNFLVIAKQECIKNAMADLGVRLGRYFSDNAVPDKERMKKANGGVDMPTDFNAVKLKTNARKI